MNRRGEARFGITLGSQMENIVRLGFFDGILKRYNVVKIAIYKKSRSFLFARSSKCATLSKGLRQRHIPNTSQSVFANKKSAKWEPTMPVMPVIRAFFFIGFAPALAFCHVFVTVNELFLIQRHE